MRSASVHLSGWYSSSSILFRICWSSSLIVCKNNKAINKYWHNLKFVIVQFRKQKIIITIIMPYKIKVIQILLKTNLERQNVEKNKWNFVLAEVSQTIKLFNTDIFKVYTYSWLVSYAKIYISLIFSSTYPLKSVYSRKLEQHISLINGLPKQRS